jgi:RHS repeat-associated protein
MSACLNWSAKAKQLFPLGVLLLFWLLPTAPALARCYNPATTASRFDQQLKEEQALTEKTAYTAFLQEGSGTQIGLLRWYDPNLQRWLTRDPSGELWDINLYRFVYSDPIDWFDPNGLGPMKGGEQLIHLNNGRGGLDGVFGKLWNAPNTALGLLWGGLGIPFGAKPSFGNNGLQFANHPFQLGGDITLGNVTCYRKGMGPKDPLFPGSPYNFGDHERQHTKQGQQLGPFFFPAYGMFGLNSLIKGGDFLGLGNYMERGPYLPELGPEIGPPAPPRPWP